MEQGIRNQVMPSAKMGKSNSVLETQSCLPQTKKIFLVFQLEF
jgi:hypothetical protein